MAKGTNTIQNQKWTEIFCDYDVINKIEQEGIFTISADEINKYKEARLMTKWDSNAAQPEILRRNNINILPTGFGKYILGKFNIFQDITTSINNIIHFDISKLIKYESINFKEISSESQATNILQISGILDHFLNSNNTIGTFNGRERTHQFTFNIKSEINNQIVTIDVNKAQIEIDGGFENDENVVILEAKNILNPDFNIRQLYYPFRVWKEKINKPIRLIYSLYSNHIFRLYEYAFIDENNFSSIKLIKEAQYSLEDTKITLDDLANIRSKIKVEKINEKIPLLQANNFARVINLLEYIYLNDEIKKEDFKESESFDYRQADYYANAAKMLGLIENQKKYLRLTPLGLKLMKMNYKQKQLKLVERILSNPIFCDLFDLTILDENLTVPSDEKIVELITKHTQKNYTLVTLHRRASSFRAWIKWIFDLLKI